MDFRGRPEITVGAGGIRTRYQAGEYDGIRNEWTAVNLSGTAIIILDYEIYYRLKYVIGRIWGGFFVGDK